MNNCYKFHINVSLGEGYSKIKPLETVHTQNAKTSHNQKKNQVATV